MKSLVGVEGIKFTKVSNFPVDKTRQIRYLKGTKLKGEGLPDFLARIVDKLMKSRITTL